jgi:hypothetical protein
MGREILSLLCLTGVILFIAFCVLIWILTLRPSISKLREPGLEFDQKLRNLFGCVVAPLVALIDLSISLVGALLKIFGAVGGVILIAFALLLSPLILVVYFVFLSLKYASILGERLLQRSIDFPDQVESQVTQILARFGINGEPPDSSNP